MIKVDMPDLSAALTGTLFSFIRKYAEKATTAEEVQALAAVAGVLVDVLIVQNLPQLHIIQLLSARLGILHAGDTLVAVHKNSSIKASMLSSRLDSNLLLAPLHFL